MKVFYTKDSLTERDFDYLIVGAGFAGSVMAERLANISYKKVLIVECRNHIGGNAYDYYNHAGVLVHKYGPHIFHTNSRMIFNYLSRFTKWRFYEHKVRAYVEDKLLPIPINRNTINQLYDLNLTSDQLKKYFDSVKVDITNICSAEDVIVSQIGYDLYAKFFKNYTLKQWGCDPSQLDKSVTLRIPIRTNTDDRYFTDKYQFMPLLGYEEMFKKMLLHDNIYVLFNTKYNELKDDVSFKRVIYTGPIDEYFDYCYGKLPYRSIKFKHVTFNTELFQPAAVINYPNNFAYTRVTEYKYLTGQSGINKTSISYEFPCWEGDPYYPVPRPENRSIYLKYKREADNLPNVHFVGRLATYHYYNMDQVIGQALTLYKNISGC